METRRFAFALSALVLAAGGVRALGCLADLPPETVADGGVDANADVGADVGANPVADSGLDADAGVPLCGNGYTDLEAGEQCDPGPPGAASASLLCTPNCQVRCPSGFVWSGNNHCYWAYWASPTLNLNPEAEDRCAAGGGHVVTFASEGEFSAVEENLVTEAGAVARGAPPFWVGLTTVSNRSYVSVALHEPGWDPSCSGCYAHASDAGVQIARYVVGDSGPSSQACVAASADPADPLWHQRPCMGVRTRVVCEREPIGSQSAPCEAGVCIDLVATRASRHYVFRSTPASPEGAAASCASMGGRLAVLRSRDEREQLWFQLAQVPSQAPTAVWIGLALADGGTSPPDGGPAAPVWLWDDGTPADAPDAYPSPWGDRQPVTGGATTRAYLRSYPDEVDDTLARNDAPQANPPYALPYVCEVPASATPSASRDGGGDGP